MAKVLIPQDIKEKMGEFPDVDWSRLLREAVEQELKRRALLTMLDKMFEKSVLTDEDALELGRKLRAAGAKELVEKGMV